MANVEFQRVKGFQDIFGDNCAYWHEAENMVYEVFGLFNIQEIRLPMLEYTEVFSRGVGETTDIVEKEMFTFIDRDSKDEKGESLTMRPEGTAGTVRAYIEYGMYNPPSLKKLYYLGNMFRRERPQKGKFRQFTQAGIEYIGISEPFVDADVINVMYTFFKRLNLLQFTTMEINSVGCPECRPSYHKKLVEYFQAHKEVLCEDCNRRLLRNPLRILDCKVEKCKTITADAPKMLDYLCNECGDHFEEVKRYLRLLNVEFKINTMMVRGLDYYVRTAFEMTTSNLGAASAVGGGGRYDGLVSTLGGPNIPGVGFAIGIDRVVELMKLRGEMYLTPPCVYIITFEDTQEAGINLLSRLRDHDIRAEIDYELKGMKNQMKKADRSGAKYALIVGEEELKENKVTFRDLSQSEQITLDIDEAVSRIISK